MRSVRSSLSSRLENTYLAESTLTIDNYMWTRSSRFHGSWLDFEAINKKPLGSLLSCRSSDWSDIIWRYQGPTWIVMFWSHCSFLKCCNRVFRHHLLSSIFLSSWIICKIVYLFRNRFHLITNMVSDKIVWNLACYTQTLISHICCVIDSWSMVFQLETTFYLDIEDGFEDWSCYYEHM